MPHANVWIRKEDYDAWRALENKAEFIHAALNSSNKQPAVKQPPIVNVPGVISADELECPRHHVPFKNCEDKH